MHQMYGSFSSVVPEQVDESTQETLKQYIFIYKHGIKNTYISLQFHNHVLTSKGITDTIREADSICYTWKTFLIIQ